MIPENLIIVWLINGALWIGKLESEGKDGLMLAHPRMMLPQGGKFVMMRPPGRPVCTEIKLHAIANTFPVAEESLSNLYLEDTTGIKLTKQMPAKGTFPPGAN